MESDTLCCLLALSEVKNYLISLPQERGWGGGGGGGGSGATGTAELNHNGCWETSGNIHC